MNKEDAKKVLEALNSNRIMSRDYDGNYTREVTPKIVTEAIAIMQAQAAYASGPKGRKLVSESPTFMGEPVLPNRWAAVQLERDTKGQCKVSLNVGGKWVLVLVDSGDVISHVCHPSGIAKAVNTALASATEPLK